MLPAPRVLLFALALAALWLPIIYLLSPQWTVYEQYSYGWAVPLLCLYLVWQRWRSLGSTGASPVPAGDPPGDPRAALCPLPSHLQGSTGASPVPAGAPPSDQFPVPSPPRSGGTGDSPVTLGDPPKVFPSAFPLLIILSAFLFLLLPTRILQEANPFWRAASYALAFEAIGITLLLVYFARGFPAARHFAFPVCFFLIAVPWPTPLEVFVVQNLTRFNTLAVTEVMHGMGIAALAHGNVIEVSTGMLGVEEACSGIRSLQAVLMLALFFGELHRLTVLRRVTLLVAGLATALLLNIVRTAILVFMAARHSIEFSNRWHDTTGTVVLVICFGAVWAIGRMLRLPNAQSETAGNQTPVKSLEGRDLRVPISLGKCHGEIGDSCHSPLQVDLGNSPYRRITSTSVSRKLLWSVIVCSAISVVGSELWFRVHERKNATAEQWTINLPRERLGFREDAISSGVKSALQYDTGTSSVWQNDDGTQWQLFSFRWNPAKTLNDRVRVHLAKSHRPEGCLPAGGWQLRTEFPATSVEVAGLSLLFRTYDFVSGGRSVFVFFCVREDGAPSGSAANMRESHASRWRAAWEGNRGLGQRSIEIAIFGARDLAHAETALRQELPKLIHIQANPL